VGDLAEPALKEKRMDGALIIIDVQNDYFPGGAMALSGMDAAAANTRRLLAAAREQANPVVHIQHLSAHPGATFFLPGTPGAEINEMAAPLPGEPVVQKHFPNSFRDTDLLERLRSGKIERLTICGAMSHMCVDATTRAAFDFGFQCTVVADACATRDLAYRGATIAADQVHGAFMAALQPIYAKLPTTDEAVA